MLKSQQMTSLGAEARQLGGCTWSYCHGSSLSGLHLAQHILLHAGGGKERLDVIRQGSYVIKYC
jgi:hypothetical protein